MVHIALLFGSDHIGLLVIVKNLTTIFWVDQTLVFAYQTRINFGVNSGCDAGFELVECQFNRFGKIYYEL